MTDKPDVTLPKDATKTTYLDIPIEVAVRAALAFNAAIRDGGDPWAAAGASTIGGKGSLTHLFALAVADLITPVPMLLWCPLCHMRHIDEGWEGATTPHATHSCQGCGLTWKPAKVPTVGVMFLPGYKNEPIAAPAAAPSEPAATHPAVDLGPHPCGCPQSDHPAHRNYMEATAERIGKVCALGWTVKP